MNHLADPKTTTTTQDMASQGRQSSSGATLCCLAKNKIFTHISKSYAIHHRMLCCWLGDF